MVHFVITRDFYNTAERGEFIEAFEEILTDLGIELQATNQSTYFGEYKGEFWRAKQFIRELLTKLEDLDWERDDVVTVYYPSTKRIGENYKADIGVHFLKNKGHFALHTL